MSNCKQTFTCVPQKPVFGFVHHDHYCDHDDDRDDGDDDDDDFYGGEDYGQL